MIRLVSCSMIKRARTPRMNNHPNVWILRYASMSSRARESEREPMYYIQPGEVMTYQQRQSISGPVCTVQPGDTKFFLLSDGRTMCYAQYGLQGSTGGVIVAYHGFPGSRMGFLALHRWAESRKLRIIAPDRPSFGHSSPCPNKRLVHYPEDVLELLNHLQIKQHCVYGVSGGAGPALASAFCFPKSMLLVTGIMAGIAPPEAFRRSDKSYTFRQRNIVAFFDIFQPCYLAYLTLRSAWDNLVSRWEERLDRVLDRTRRSQTTDHLSNRTVATNAAKNWGIRDYKSGDVNLRLLKFQEEVRQGVWSFLEDRQRLRGPWGFELDKVDSNKIISYHGTDDKNCPYRWALYNERLLNKHRKQNWLYKCWDLDHYSIQDRYHCELLEELRKLLRRP